jgi:uncharacterized membrane protein HdeD (DUF308 family)
MTDKTRRDNSRADQVIGDAADRLGRVGRHWGWVLAFGIVTLLAGIVALAWPGRTLLVIAVVFGLQLIVTGIFRFVAAFAADDLAGGTRVLLAVLGLLSLIIGLYALRHVLITVLALALLLGIYWIISGVVELFTALSQRGVADRGWTGITGVLSLIAGIVVLAYPGISLVALAIVVAVWLVVFGVLEIIFALQLRPAGRRAGSRMAQTT